MGCPAWPTRPRVQRPAGKLRPARVEMSAMIMGVPAVKLNPRLPGKSRSHEERPQVRIAAHEVAEELRRVGAVAAAQDLGDEFGAHLRIEEPLAPEPREGIRFEDLRPLVGIVAGGVAD